ncbi:MAG: methyl-accepting chemotaxis protein [Acidovorax sp.]|nr:methyl-accepting chemotaxis protein [Acidovorax sp.]
MRVLGQLSIRARLYFATTFSLVLLTAVGALGYVALDRSRSTLQELFARQVQTLTDMAELRTGLGHLRRAEKDIIINFNNAVEVQALREGWSRQLDALRKSMAQVREVQAGNVEFTGALDEALAEVGQYEGGLVPIFDQIERALLDGAGAGAYAERFKAHMDTTDALLASLATQARGHMEEARAALDQRTATMSTLIAAAVLLGLAVLVPLTLFSVRSITQSLEQARALAERIAAGDLSHAVQSRQRDEIGSLVAAMGRMQDALRTLVGQVQQAAGSIATASDEIALGNQDLSQRTEQTAASLQQTASSMELLTGTVQHSAESSRQASGLAANAAEVAVRGGAVVAQVVQTMGQISDSSRRIGDITGVIDSIAFQTNILALNAAVEAARAGEQGRGFAVVAGEVRNLAQRSADAAKEIKGLIGASVERVEQGSQLVDKAGGTMEEVVTAIRRVTDIMGEISAASKEQASGVAQVGEAITQMDQTTQQNAALVEQSAAAAASLQTQAGELVRAVAVFTLEAQSTGGMQVRGSASTPAVLPPAHHLRLSSA